MYTYIMYIFQVANFNVHRYIYIYRYMYRSYWYSDSLIHSETFFLCEFLPLETARNQTSLRQVVAPPSWQIAQEPDGQCKCLGFFFLSRRKVHFLMLKLFITCPTRKFIFKTFQCLRIYHVEDVSGDPAVWRKLLTLDWSNSHARRSSRSWVVLTIFFVAEGHWLSEPH